MGKRIERTARSTKLALVRTVWFWIPFILITLLLIKICLIEIGWVIGTMLMVVGMVANFFICIALSPILMHLFSAASGVKGMKDAKAAGTEEEGFEKKRITLSITAAAVLIVSIIVIILLLMNFGAGPAFIGFLAAAAAYVFLVQMPKKKLSQNIKDQSLPALLAEKFTAVKSPDDADPLIDAVKKADVFEEFNTAGTNDVFSGERNGISFHRADIFLRFKTEYTSLDQDGEESTSTSYKDIFKGSVISTETKLDVPEMKLIICSDGIRHLSTKKLQRRDVEMYSFNRQLDIFTDSHEAALVLLKPQIIEGINALSDICACDIIMHFGKEGFLLFINDGTDWFEIDPARKTVAAGIEDSRKHVEKLADIIDAMKFLNS